MKDHDIENTLYVCDNWSVCGCVHARVKFQGTLSTYYVLHSRLNVGNTAMGRISLVPALPEP